MAKQKKSGISWTDETWNPVVGCTKISDGCKNCWAERQAHLHYSNHPHWAGGVADLTDAAARWTGNIGIFEKRLEMPLRLKSPRRIAVGLMGDLFHPMVPTEFILRIFETMAAAQQHTFQVLTKRPERMKHLLVYPEDNLLPDAYFQWAGVTGCLQPLKEKETEADDYRYFRKKEMKLDWVIVGGESGPGARPMHPDWVRSIRDQCQAAGVPFHFKQWGECCWPRLSILRASRPGHIVSGRRPLAAGSTSASGWISQQAWRKVSDDGVKPPGSGGIRV